mmetsp:Transcript_3215/g.11610  ORF Transcript_3215/g.11610 Transcript_3215/m.11610 type:complete len:83 (+) Transcript_3215:92-340(+)
MSSALRRTSTLAARALARRADAKTSFARTQTRGYAADPNAPPKVPYPWNDPMNPSNWKEEHVVFAVLGGWAVVIAGAKSAFS